MRWEAVEQVVVGEQDGDLGLLEQEGEAVAGVGRVEGDVSAASLEDGQDGDEHVGGARQAERDEGLGSDALGVEMVSELIGAAVEVVEGEMVLLEDDGDGLWGALHLLLRRARAGTLVRIVHAGSHSTRRATAVAQPGSDRARSERRR